MRTHNDFLWWIRSCLEVLLWDKEMTRRVSSRLYPVAISMGKNPNHGHWQCQEWNAKPLGVQHFQISMLVFMVVILFEIVCVSATTCFGSTINVLVV